MEKEAIEYFYNVMETGNIKNDIQQSAYEMAIDALEKRIPKEVKNRKILMDFHQTPYTIRGDCPICGSVGLLASNTDYCNACGQKLKWDADNLKD